MKKLIAFVLVAALIFCCVGCTPEVPEVTDPSGTQPTETDPTGTGQTDATGEPTNSDEPEVLNYTWEQVPGYLSDRTSTMVFISVINSLDALQNSDYQGWKFAEKYDDNFFGTKTLIIASFLYGPPVGHVVSDFVQNEDGTYLLTIERLTYGGLTRDVEFGTTVVIEVDALIDPEAEIIVDITETKVSDDWGTNENIFDEDVFR